MVLDDTFSDAPAFEFRTPPEAYLRTSGGVAILNPPVLVKHEAWGAARAPAAKFLTSDDGKVQAAIPGTDFGGYLRGANSAYNKRFCGSRCQVPANYVVDGKGSHDDPEVVAGILSIGLYLNAQGQVG